MPYNAAELPLQIRVSVGSAIILGLLEGKLDVEPTTAYLMTYNAGKCVANCSFCPQARTSRGKAEMLSRISWPSFPINRVLKGVETAFNEAKIGRVCIQALNYPEVFSHLVALVQAIKQHAKVPVSVSCQPSNRESIRGLAVAGVDRVGISVDAATERLFDEVKGSGGGGPYDWEQQFARLREAVEIFGEGNVSTHLIVGLGETEEDAARVIQESVDMSVLPALFAFTPVRGTALENKRQPEVASYRRVQIARYLIVKEFARCENMRFNFDGRIVDFGVGEEVLREVIASGEPFLTSGCPSCNRPFYNEKPSGPIYNFPRRVRFDEIASIMNELEM